MKSSILHKTIAIIVILVVCALLLLLVLKPGFAHELFQWIGKVWLWLVGLAGSAVLGFKKIGDFFSGKGSLRNISESNDELKKRLDTLEAKMNQTDQKYNLEKQLYQKEIELLQYKLTAKEQEIQSLTKTESKVENESDSTYWDSLSDTDKARIQKNIDDHTIFMQN